MIGLELCQNQLIESQPYPLNVAGFISDEYLRECLMTMGDRWSEEQVDELFHGAPIVGGRFDYLEFTRTLKHGAREKDEESQGQSTQGQVVPRQESPVLAFGDTGKEEAGETN